MALEQVGIVIGVRNGEGGLQGPGSEAGENCGMCGESRRDAKGAPRSGWVLR